MPGWNVADNNLLACSRDHIEAVFDMLEQQARRPEFTGGLEAARLEGWHVDAFLRLKPTTIWFAYDTPDDWEPLVTAAKALADAGLMGGKHRACCYVLAGWNRLGRQDTIEAADERIRAVVQLGFFPQAMLMDDGRDWIPAERRQWKDWSWGWINKEDTQEEKGLIMTEETKDCVTCRHGNLSNTDEPCKECLSRVRAGRETMFTKWEPEEGGRDGEEGDSEGCGNGESRTDGQGAGRGTG
jgi:hypothetical protein